MMMQVHIADTCSSKSWRPYEVEWEGFVNEKLRQPIRTDELFEQYKTLSKEEKTWYKDRGGYVFGRLLKNSRKKHDVISRNALLYDLDFAPLNVWERLTALFSFEMVLHSSHSHEINAPRFRLIIPLHREVTPDEYECIARTIAYWINIEYFDKTTFQRNRLMYFPTVSFNGEWVFEWQRGEFLNADWVLQQYTDWRDMSTWAYHPEEKISHGNGQTRQDPTEAQGVIGAFNRCYSIDETINTFLSDKYVHAQGDRYTFLQGSSAMGAVSYEDKFLYSFHATDPAQGRLLNAFELLACHLFEDDIKKATTYAMALPEVRKEAVVNTFEDCPEFDDEEKVKEDWYGELEIDKDNKVKATDRNIRLIFDNDRNLKDVFRYNEFANNIYLVRNTSWRKGNVPQEGDSIRNTDYPCLRTYFGLKYGLTNRSMIEENMQTVAFEHKYHPVATYLCSLEWDGVERLSTTLQDYFGVEDNTYTREVFKKTLIGAVLRVFAPTKHDNILTLVGAEGTAKSEFIKRLGLSWFSDTFDMSRGKEVYEQLQAKWIIEIGEIDRLTRVEVGQVKNFTAKQFDSYRPAYGHVVEDFRRQCMFIGTTNEDNFLKSENGNRRFYPVTVTNGMYERGLHRSKKYVWTDMSRYEVDQMWAEAVSCVMRGERNNLSKEAVQIIDGNMSEYEEQSVLSGEIDLKLMTLVPNNFDDMTVEQAMDWLNNPAFRNDNQPTRFIEYISGIQLWVEFLGRTRESYRRLEQLEMLSAIRKSKLIDSKDSELKHTRYGRQRIYKVNYE